MDETTNSDFFATDKTNQIFANDNLNFSSDLGLDYLDTQDLAINGQNYYDIGDFKLDTELLNVHSSSDVFDININTSENESSLISTNDLNSISADELTGMSSNLNNSSDFKIDNDNYETILKQGISETVSHLQDFSQQDNLDVELEKIFGDSHNIQLTKKILQDAGIDGNLSFPNIEVLASEKMTGANGAYAELTNTIYLSEAFLTQHQNSPNEIAHVLLEEFGHYIDAQVNDMDTLGDEGAIFANTLNQNSSLSATELSAISIEDDHSTIFLENQLLSVENSSSFSTYKIQPGDTLWNIAAQKLGSGTRWTEIQKEDGFGGATFGASEAGSIKVGQLVYIPLPKKINDVEGDQSNISEFDFGQDSTGNDAIYGFAGKDGNGNLTAGGGFIDWENPDKTSVIQEFETFTGEATASQHDLEFDGKILGGEAKIASHEFSGDFATLNGNSGFDSGKAGAMLNANILEGNYSNGAPNPESDNDVSVNGGASLGFGGGFNFLYSDPDNDGVRNKGFEAALGPFSFGLTFE